MVNKELVGQVEKLGYELINIENRENVNKILAEVIKSKDKRLLEGFPVLLANAIKDKKFELEEINRLLKSENDKKMLMNFLLISLSLYRHKHILSGIRYENFKNVISKNRKELNELLLTFKNNENFHFINEQFSSKRINSIFQSYFLNRASDIPKKEKESENLSIEYALSQIFSPKQKNLFYKKLNGEKMSKTEKEYYSRAVKKKVLSLANSKLHRLAKQILER